MAWLVYEKGEEINEYVDVCRLVLTGWLDRLLSGWLDRMLSGWHSCWSCRLESYLVGLLFLYPVDGVDCLASSCVLPCNHNS